MKALAIIAIALIVALYAGTAVVHRFESAVATHAARSA
jgi:hypothetical protein